jgi:hypothetical protein
VFASLDDDVHEHFPKPCVKVLELKSVLQELFYFLRSKFQHQVTSEAAWTGGIV